MPRHAYLEVYSDRGQSNVFRYAFVAANGVRSHHREAYTRRWNAKRAALRRHPGLEVRNLP